MAIIKSVIWEGSLAGDSLRAPHLTSVKLPDKQTEIYVLSDQALKQGHDLHQMINEKGVSLLFKDATPSCDDINT